MRYIGLRPFHIKHVHGKRRSPAPACSGSTKNALFHAPIIYGNRKPAANNRLSDRAAQDVRPMPSCPSSFPSNSVQKYRYTGLIRNNPVF